MNEVVPIEQPKPLDIYRQSTDAASVCKEIVLATSTTISSRRFVTVEGWQAIAVTHGCVASAVDVRRVTDEGATGYAATGVLRRMSDGQEIGRAEGFVGDDERTWGKRDVYAKRAMAQTRAISRVCRSAFAHVVVMMKAGLATTPAEEVPPHDPETGEIIDTPVREKVPGITKIKERLNAFMREGNACADIDEFRALVKANRADIKTVRDANHEYWVGDGADWEGFGKWMEGRYADLTPQAESEQLSMLHETLEACTSTKELAAWFKLNARYVDTLAMDEQDRVKVLYDQKEASLKEAEAEPT